MSTHGTKEFDRGGLSTGWVGILFPEGGLGDGEGGGGEGLDVVGDGGEDGGGGGVSDEG